MAAITICSDFGAPKNKVWHCFHCFPIYFSWSDTVSKNNCGADCGSDHELLIAKFRLKLKKVGETTRPFRYDLNQIPYDSTVEVRNRYKGLDLIDSVWWTMDGGSWHCTGDRDQDHPHGKEMQKSKLAIWGGGTNSCIKKRREKQRRKGKIFPFECRVPKNSKEW